MKTIFIFFFLLIFSIADAQTLLTIDDAIKIALKNNYGILVARNDAAISKTNNTIGNAGMLPNVAVTGNGSYNVDKVNQTLPGGTESNYSALSTKSLSAGAELSWTLFDGGKMFVTKNKLNEIEALGEIQFKDKVLQTQFDVIAAYYDVVRQKQELQSIIEIINYNTELVKILQTSFNGGLLLKTNLLQAKIDLNVFMEDSINQQFTIDAAKKSLNKLLGLRVDSLPEVSDSIPLSYSIDKTDLLNKLNSSNTSILSYQKQIDIAKLTLKEFTRTRYPLVNFNTGYYLTQTDYSAGSILKSRTSGPQFGGSVSIPIFQGGKVQREIATSKIDVESAEFNLENIKLQVTTDLLNAVAEFENQQRLLIIEKKNKELTVENLDISLQRMKLGQTTSLEVHQAQENYVQSCTRLINFEYEVKIAEIRLKQLLSIL
jgi:outer membrane protein